jgi:hypothetical protein
MLHSTNIRVGEIPGEPCQTEWHYYPVVELIQAAF